MKSLKYLLPAILFLSGILLLDSCKKENEADEKKEPEFFIRFKANNEPVEYKGQTLIMGGFAQKDNHYLGGITSSDENGSNFGFVIYSSSPITTGTYSGLSSLTGKLTGVLFGYKKNGSETIYSNSDVMAALLSTVTITELTDEIIKGTFSAKVKAADNPDINITNGEFLVKRVYDYTF